MMESSTTYLILAMALFIFVAVIMVHHHSNTDQIRRKTGEVEDYTNRLNMKIEIIEREIVDLKLQIDDLDEEIDSYKS